MNFITKRIHAYLDYPVAVALIILPFIFGLGGSNLMALYLSLVIGSVAFILTLLTDHHLGIFRLISYRVHLFFDFLIAIMLIISPIIFSFEGLDAYYYWVNGTVILIIVSLHKFERPVPQWNVLNKY